MLVTRSSANRDVSIDAAFGEIFERTVWLCRQGVKGECVGRFHRNGLLPAVQVVVYTIYARDFIIAVT